MPAFFCTPRVPGKLQLVAQRSPDSRQPDDGPRRPVSFSKGTLTLVNPPGQSAGGAIAGLQLQALNSDSLRYLGQQVGKVIEARVIQVITQLPTDASSANNKPALATRESTPLRDNTRPNPAERYELRLSIDNKHTLKVESPLAPRIGQLLQLAVIDNQQLRIIGTGSRGANVAGQNTPASLFNPAASNNAASSPATSTNLAGAPARQAAGGSVQQSNAAAQPLLNAHGQRPTTQGANPANSINSALSQALRDALPKQLGRTELGSALTALVTARASAQQTSPAQSANATNPSVATPAAKAPGTAGNNSPAATSSLNIAGTKPLPAAIPSPPAGITRQSPAAAAAANANPGSLAGSTAQAQTSTLQLNASVQQAGAQLGAAIADARSLADPAKLREALLNSGLFYERKLANFATTLRSRQTIAGTVSDAAPKASQANTSQPLQLEPRARAELLENLRGDLKHRVLTLASQLRASLPGQLAATPLLAGETAQSERSMESVLANLWQIAGGGTALNQSSESRQQLDPILQLLRLALGSGARTQAQQLVALGSQFASQADPQINQFLNMELPVWLDQRLSLVEVRIEREKAAREARRKIETWNVRLHFDLEESGELTALATLQGKRMAAVLWASAANLAEVIQRELSQVTQQLTEHGLDVQHLQCRTGAAPEAAEHGAINVLSMNLLDTQS